MGADKKSGISFPNYKDIAKAHKIKYVQIFNNDEIKYLRKKPFIKPIDLGPRILKSDTAVITSLVLWHCLNGNMKKYTQFNN